MASTSSNTSLVTNNVCRYDVFLSFQGETRFTFTDQLYKALQDAGLVPFMDNEEIDRGEDLQPGIERGIRESRASIVVLSTHYATSRWCLDELCLILEQATKRRHFVLPIFYHVDPAHVRNQEEGFEINVIPDDTKWTEDNVERWKAALKKVGNMAGEVPSGPETKFSEKVVAIIEKKLDLNKVYHKANLVGMDTWRTEIDYWFKNSSVQILAIWGMGGIGKTTLARHIVYSNWENFGSISILEDIGSKSTEQLHELQQKLLRDLLQGKKRKIPSVWQGTCKIENALQTERALIVLDNIVQPSHLFVLLGAGIETQCKIVITTRESNPYKWFDQSTWRCQELEMKSLDKNDSLELLSHHAFGSTVPTKGYDNLVEKALRYCEGNPLALEVLGSSLSRKTKQYWESKLKLFENELHDGIHSVLIRSYESLPHENCKRLFLHIACFFVGKNRDYVVKILDPDFSAFCEIETLSKSCLLSISPNNELMMHRMLQEMARKIVYKESPLNPVKRSRVWRDAESYDILKNGKGSKNIEGLSLDINLLNQGKEQHENKSSSDLTTESFKKMKQLKLLQLNGVGLSGPYENFSEHLRWLCWIGFGLRAIPSDLCMKNLVAIDMSYSFLEEFEPPADLHSLKFLNLRSSKKLGKIRNIHRLRYLEILILWDCTNLTHVTLGGLTCLVILNIIGCKKLCTREEISPLVSQKGLFQKIKRKLSQKGSSFHSIKSTQQASFLLPQSLKRLFASSCNLNDTDYFPLTFKDQLLLKYLNLVNGLFEFLPSYNHLKRLRVLDVSGCNDLKELLHLPSTLAELYIYYCNSLNIVTFESHRFALQEFGYEGCVSLCEVEGLFKLMPLTKVGESDLKHMTWLREYQHLNMCLVGDAELTKGRSSCVQMLYEFNIMSTSLPNIKNSNMMTDTDYMYTSQSTLLSFKVPACPEHRRLEGLIISFQYTAHGEDWVWFAKVNTPSGVNLMYNPRVFGKPDEVGMWSSYWPIGNALKLEETVTVSIIVIKGLLDIHWCGARLVDTDEVANEALQENKECVAILGENFSEFQLSTGAYYLCRCDLFELMEAGKVTSDWFRSLVDDKIDYTEVGGWRMTGKPEHPYQSYTEVKTIRCIMHGPEMEEIYKIAELSKSSLVNKSSESTSVLNKAIPKEKSYKITELLKSFLVDKTMKSTSVLHKGGGKLIVQEFSKDPPNPKPLPVPKKENAMSRHGTSNQAYYILGHKTENIRDVYTLGQKLGQGQFGTTYLCTEIATGVDYACKSISKRKLISKEDLGDVRREIQIMHHLAGHKNIVTIKGAYEDALYVHIVMELCTGGELFDRIIQRGRYSERKAAELIKIIVGVVEACHSLGVMHRNLKPEKFLLVNRDDDFSIKAIGFGLSVFFKPGQIFTDVVGSPYYVAPEVLLKHYGPEADVWTAGVILYILLSGFPPFWAETQQGIFDAVLKGYIDFESDPWPLKSDSAKDLIRRMLCSQPSDRLTAHEVLCHPWICENGVAPDRALDPAVLSRLKQFCAMNKLKKMALRVIAESLSEEEIAGLREMFKAMDTDNSGAITFDELKAGLRKFGSTLKDTEIRDLMDAADVDNSGTIDYGEFVAATIHLNKLEREEHLVAAFQYFDKDGSGFITVDELQQACADHNMTDFLVEDIIKEVDQDNDGRIDYGEFVAMMTKGNAGVGRRTMRNSLNISMRDAPGAL